jgi:serine/threonine protein kinase
MSLPIFSNYTVIRELGQGGMATVYLATNHALGHQVAIKILDKQFAYNQNIKSRFIEEAKKLVRLDHSNVVKVTDFISENEHIAYVMEYINGKSLRELLNATRLTDVEIENYLNQMVVALNYIHKEGIVHRDIKPSNFIIATNGTLKLVDFGISKSIDASSVDHTSTSTNLSMGTLLYMSPEQIKSTKDVTYLSDIYSLGVVLWEMAMGKVPYNTSELSAFDIQVKIVQEKLPNTNTKWDEYIQIATSKEENQRVRFIDLLKYKHSNESTKTFETERNEKTVIERNDNVLNKPKNNTNDKELYSLNISKKSMLFGAFTILFLCFLVYFNFYVRFTENYYKLYLGEIEYRIFERNSKYGVADKNGLVVIEPQYSNIQTISDKYFVCKLGNIFGLLNANGDVLIPFEYESIFMTDYFHIQTVKNKKIGLFDLDLNRLFSDDYDDIIYNRFFKNDSTAIGGKSFDILIAKNKMQVEILNLTNSKRYYFEGVKSNSISEKSPYLFVKRNNKWGIINFENFTIVQPFIYDDIDREYRFLIEKEDYSNICLGYYRIKKLYGVFDENGEVLTSAKYTKVELSNSLINVDNIVNVAFGTDGQGRHFDIDQYGNERENFWHGITPHEMLKRIRRGENSYSRP